MTNGAWIIRIGALAGLVLSAALAPLGAQQAVKVIRRTPADSGTAGTLITVTFDRPIAGMAGRTVDARQVMTLEPAVPGVTEWRDPATVRFVPTDPFVPGRSYIVSIDTAVASGAKRSGAVYKFTARFPGATPLAMNVAQQARVGQYGTGPMPTLRVVYSAPVNLDSVALLSRLAFSPQCGGDVPLVPVRQRPIVKGDGYDFETAGGYDRDTIADHFRRVVELVPRDSLRPDCRARWHIASFDPARPGDTWNYHVQSGPLFRVESVLPCHGPSFTDTRTTVCDPDGLRVALSVPVSREMMARYIHVSPPLTLPVFDGPEASILDYGTTLTPREQYTVTIDTAIRDTHGRRLQGQREFTVRAQDRAPGIRQQSGFATVPRPATGKASVSVRVVNVARMVMRVVAIPDSIMPYLLGTPEYMRYGLLQRVRHTLTDTTFVHIPLDTPFNAETTLSVPLPERVGGAGYPQLHAISFAIVAAAIAPDSVAIYALRDSSAARLARGQSAPQGFRGGRAVSSSAGAHVLSQVVVRANIVERDFGLIVQVSNIAAHAKVANDDRGAVYVTDAEGQPLGGATISLVVLVNPRTHRELPPGVAEPECEI